MGKEIYVVITYPDRFHYYFHHLNNARDCAWEMYKDMFDEDELTPEQWEYDYFQLITYNYIPDHIEIATGYYEDDE